jgi:transposase
MATIQRRLIHGRPYFYLVESRRVNGKPRPVVLKYLGRAEDLLAKLEAAQERGRPVAAMVRDFGAVVALWDLAARLGLVSLIDTQVPKRSQGVSVGTYLTLAAINRCVAPTSKRRFAQWYGRTCLQRICRVPSQALSSQRFWDHMSAVDEAAILAIEEQLSQRLVERFGLALSSLLFDCTNFDTFIDSRTPSALAQRGNAKSKRTDLRIIGLALLVSSEFHIPLFSKLYAGNQHDSVTFGSVTQELVKRYRLLAGEAEQITLVFDKGNNSPENIEAVANSPYHIVGSLSPAHQRELLEVPLSKFESLGEQGLEGVSAYRSRKEVFGRQWTVVVSRSEELLEGQLRGIAQHWRKRSRALRELQGKLRRSQQPGAKGKGYTREALEAHAQRLAQGQYLGQILKIQVEQKGGRLRLRYRTDPKALSRLEQTILGKRILFTDQHEWSTAEIIRAYRGLHHVEDAFRQMKDPAFVSWTPMHHWTDQKIRVHAFYCVLALTLASLLQREVAKAGIRLSVEELLEQLQAIQEVVNLYPTAGERGGRPRSETTPTRTTPLQSRLTQVLGLERYAARTS